jgi:N-acetylmuramoyl-L-alanine amidase
MARSGFVPYRGDSYGTLYIEDEVVPGVFVDRHEPHQRIKMLRRPVMPSVLVETHHAWVADEAELWTHPVVVVAFADALFEAVTQGR